MSKRNTQARRTTRRASKKALDFEALLKGAIIAVVPLRQIDLGQRKFSFREVVEACDPATFCPRRGTIDGTGPHPIMLFEIGNHRYAVLNGLRRPLGMARNSAVKRVRALVFSGISDEGATVIAARANLAHGVPLTCSEKRRAGIAEIRARLARGERLPPLRDLADVHHVWPETIRNWTKMAKRNEHAKNAASRDDRIGGPRAKPAAVPDQSTNEPGKSTAPATRHERTLDDVFEELDAVSLELVHDFADAKPSAEHHRCAGEVVVRLEQWRRRKQPRGDAA